VMVRSAGARQAGAKTGDIGQSFDERTDDLPKTGTRRVQRD